MEENKIKEKLEKLEGFKRRVASLILEEAEDDIIGYMKDIINYGCQSGIITGLIYYEDTNAFYDKNEEDIENILFEYRQEMGYKNRAEAISNLNGYAENIEQEKNLLCWFAVEETTRRILEDLGIEL